ncbi:MAG: hypothetical protein DHS20C17_12910 [Cyclobacteriaceae bacterium]|nr:MAG: hypothetical protein DHS20C17_12910 [Cyclobacteriaceae bacterium]
MNRLKKLTLLLLLPASVFAQSNQEELDFVQSIFGMEKKAIVSEFIALDGTAEDAFWTLYDQYETERKELGQSRFSLLNDYAENYENMSAEKINELAKRSTKQVKADEALRYKYFNKLKKAVGPKPAAQFYQIEGYFGAAIRMSILESIPFLGELDD